MVKRLLFVDHAQAMGGAENSLMMLMDHLDSTRWAFVVAGREGRFLEAVRSARIETLVTSLPRLRRSPKAITNWIGGANALAQIARRTGAHVVIANTVRAAVYAAPAAKLARLPFVWYMRDFWLSEARPSRPLLDNVGKQILTVFAKGVIANSQAVAQNLPSSSRIRVVHNGIDPADFDPAESGLSFRQQFAIPADAPLVGMVGRLRPWKGQDAFLTMAAKVVAIVPETHFAIVGGSTFNVRDDYAERLRMRAREAGLTGSIVFTGELKPVNGALAAMDVFVHPGSPEPFGLVNIEAMAMQKPVVAFAHGALPEIVIDGQTGSLVKPNDVSALAGAVIRLLDDSGLRDRMGRAGRDRVEQHFTVSQAASGVQRVLAAVCAESKSDG